MTRLEEDERGLALRFCGLFLLLCQFTSQSPLYVTRERIAVAMQKHNMQKKASKNGAKPQLGQSYAA